MGLKDWLFGSPGPQPAPKKKRRRLPKGWILLRRTQYLRTKESNEKGIASLEAHGWKKVERG